ncbi:hypothetical protein OESDEN_12717 [Oesophagostomum dentatum]|uniref:Uncharacterized protein n=1 Tax=Oesophagostomum dentatum TaxID=61180 RepID=A0A0B1SQA2_OESDE|nr:hypothetical protein OESDEN_12717 [Oesophagostomum dentatum]
MSLLGQINSLLSYLPEISFPKKKSVPSITPVAPHSTSICVDMSPFVRIAGLSGALAVAFGAYGGHKVRDDPSIEVRRKNAMAAGSQYHLIHTLALLGAPRARYPWVTTAVFLG